MEVLAAKGVREKLPREVFDRVDALPDDEIASLLRRGTSPCACGTARRGGRRMKISEFFVQNFGIFSGSGTSLSKGLTIFHGENESGKTTLMNFFRRILFPREKYSRTRGNAYEPAERRAARRFRQSPYGGRQGVRHHARREEELRPPGVGRNRLAASVQLLLHR